MGIENRQEGSACGAIWGGRSPPGLRFPAQVRANPRPVSRPATATIATAVRCTISGSGNRLDLVVPAQRLIFHGDCESWMLVGQVLLLQWVV